MAAETVRNEVIGSLSSSGVRAGDDHRASPVDRGAPNRATRATALEATR
jgi:hypothetical protein